MQSCAGVENVVTCVLVLPVKCRHKILCRHLENLLKSQHLYYKNGCELKYVLSYNVNQIPESQRGRINMYKLAYFREKYYLCYFSS